MLFRSIDKLNELDTTNVEPMSHVFPVQNVFREDVVENGDGGEDTLANAPERRDRAFVVPKTVSLLSVSVYLSRPCSGRQGVITRRNQNEIGSEIFGLDSASFKRSAFIAQNDFEWM